MKRLIYLIVFLFSLNSVVARDLGIMSFNIQGHGPGSSAHRMGKTEWENQIIKIINLSDASIVLLQEIPLKDTPHNLAKVFVERLNKKENCWDYISSVPYSISSMDLNNAVLYNKKHVTLIGDFAKKSPFNMYTYKENQNEDTRRYKFIKNNEQILEFVYNEIPDSSFMLVNVHLPGPDENEKKFEERQQLELLYASYKRKMPIIIAGDFNISRKDLIRGSNFSDAIIDGDQERFADVWGQKTTVSSSDIKSFSLIHDYDHFIISKNNLFTITEQMHLVFSKEKKEKLENLKIGKHTYTNAYTYWRGTSDTPSISDHLPIMIKLKFYKQ